MLRDYTNYLVYLCRCAVTNKQPTCGFPTELDFERFFQFCYDHQLVGLAYDMISKIKTGYEDTQTMLIFKDKHNYAVLKDASREYYFGLVCESFADNGIDFAPLKGAVIKNLYPVPYYRQSSDIDILIRRKDTEKAKLIMEELGFETERFGNPDTTDNYKIDKFTCVELHKSLIQPRYKQFASCNDIPDRLILKGNHEYVMSDEDFYLFMIAHAAKHLQGSAIGIRSMLDIWIYLRKKPEINWDIINIGIKKCALNRFHERIMQIIGYWFENKECSNEIHILADYIAESGWNGSVEHRTAYALNNIGAVNDDLDGIRLKNFVKTAFMDKKNMQKRYPILEKHSLLLPLCWLHRGAEVIFKRRDSISSVIHAYDNADIDKSKRIDVMRKEFGV